MSNDASTKRLSAVLTEPAFGLVRVVEALPWARRGWEQGRVRAEEDGD